MKKHLIMAFVALLSFGMVSCGSDDDDNSNGGGTVTQTIGDVVKITGATQKTGTMPTATQPLTGVSTSVSREAGSKIANVVVESSEELSKVYVAVDGVNGYFECPASAFTTRASYTFKYTISILLNNVTQNVTVKINAETKAGKLVSIAVEKLDVKNEEGTVSNNDAKALIGTWEFNYEDFTSKYVFTDKTMQVTGMEGTTNWTYRFDDGLIYAKSSATQEIESKIKPALLCNNDVLILRWYDIMHDENGVLHEFNDIDQFEMFIRKGATLPYTSKDIQGTWIWNFHGDQNIVRSALIIKDNTFDMIIPIWGQRMQGTFTYKNGFISFKVSKFLTRGGEEYKENESMGNLLNYWTVKPEKEWESNEPPFGKEFVRPFVPDGKVAYSNLANLPVYYVKQ